MSEKYWKNGEIDIAETIMETLGLTLQQEMKLRRVFADLDNLLDSTRTALAAAAVKVPYEVKRSAEILRDWLLPYGHPEKGMVGINPIAIQPEELTYKSRDVAAMELCNFILQLAGKDGA